MNLLLVRHAEAGDPGAGGDAARPLTARGQATAGRLAATLESREIRFDAILCSPLLRARQTAEPLRRLLSPGHSHFVICDALASGEDDHAAVCTAVNATGGERIAVVGHLPDLAELAAYLLGIHGGRIEFDKGSAASLDCGRTVQAGRAKLEWLIPPEWY